MGYKHLTREQRYTIEALLQTPLAREVETSFQISNLQNLVECGRYVIIMPMKLMN